jgi:hypothetical protein
MAHLWDRRVRSTAGRAGDDDVDSLLETGNHGPVEFARSVPRSGGARDPVEHSPRRGRLEPSARRLGSGDGQPGRPAILALQRASGNRNVVALLQSLRLGSSDHSPNVQRTVRWQEGVRQRNINLVGTVTNFDDFGITPAVVNGHEFPGGAAAANTVISGATLAQTPNPNGSTTVSVTAEADNTVSYRMALPAAPPWHGSAPGNQIASSVGTFPEAFTRARATPGNVDFRVAGEPNDRQFSRLVERHEDHHVQEVKDARDEILVPWDRQIGEFVSSGRTFDAQAGENPVAAFYTLVGGTPAEIGQRLVDQFEAKGTAYHGAPEGGAPRIVDVQPASLLRRRLTITYRHPLA